MPCAMPTSRSTVAASSGAEGRNSGLAGRDVWACGAAESSSADAIRIRTGVRMATGASGYRMFSPEASMKARIIGAVAAAAIMALSSAPLGAQRGQGAAREGDNAPTPRMADGHPDLNGWWGGGGGGFGGGRSLADLTDEKGNVTLQLNARSRGSALGTSTGQLAENFERDS